MKPSLFLSAQNCAILHPLALRIAHTHQYSTQQSINPIKHICSIFSLTILLLPNNHLSFPIALRYFDSIHGFSKQKHLLKIGVRLTFARRALAEKINIKVGNFPLDLFICTENGYKIERRKLKISLIF